MSISFLDYPDKTLLDFPETGSDVSFFACTTVISTPFGTARCSIV